VVELAEKQLEIGTRGLVENAQKQKRNMLKGGIKVIVPTPEQKALWEKAKKPLEQVWLDMCLKQGVTVAPKLLARYKELAAAAYR